MFRTLRRCLLGLAVAGSLLFAAPTIEKASAQRWDYRFPVYSSGVPYYYNYNYRPYRQYWSPVYTNGTVVTPYGVYYNYPYGAYYGPGAMYWY